MNFHSLVVSAVNKYGKIPCTKEEERDILELDFGQMPNILKEEYLDVYEGIQSEILSTQWFDENSDLSTTYLGKADRSKNNKIKAEECYTISEQGYTMGKLLDSAECQILLDTGASKSFMWKSYYMPYKSLYSLPKFTYITQRIQVGNGQCVSVLFIIPVIVDIHGHRFEIYTLVSETAWKHRFSVRNQECIWIRRSYKFTTLLFQLPEQILTHFPKEHIMLKPKEQKLFKVKAPFIDEISGLAIIKILDGSTYSTKLLKLKFMCNAATLDIVNNGPDTIIFKPEEMLRILDLRSLDYYKIKQDILQQKFKQILQVQKSRYSMWTF